MRLQAIEVEAFRGFGEPFRFEFGAVDVLLLYGPNGHGKTSFFDAIEWALTGRLFRYDEEATAERKQYRYVGNQFHPHAQPRVQLELCLADGREVVLTRINTAKPTDVTDAEKDVVRVELDGVVYEGEAGKSCLQKLLVHADWRDSMTDLGKGLFLTHFLSQERMSRFLRGMKESERYESVSLMFGTEHFNRYRQLFQEAKRELERRLDEVEQEQHELKLEDRLLQQQLTDLAPQVESLLPEQSQLLVTGEPPLAQVQQDVQEVLRALEELQHVENRLTRAQHFFQEWQEQVPMFEANQERLQRYERLEVLEEQLRQLAWLQLWMDDYVKNDRLLQDLQQRMTRIVEQESTLRQCKEEMEYVVQVISKWLTHAGASIKPYKLKGLTVELLDLVEQNPFFSSFEQGDVFDKRFREFELAELKASSAWSLYQQALQGSEDIASGMEAYHSVQEPYMELLASLASYVETHSDAEECPACGTAGVTTDQIHSYVQRQRETIDPQALQWQERMKRAQTRLQEAQVDWKEAERLLQAALERMVQEQEGWQQQIASWQKEIQTLQRTLRQGQQEAQEVEKTVREYEGLAASVGLRATGASLCGELGARALEAEQEWTTLIRDEQSTWRATAEVCKRAFARAKEVRLALRESLQALGLEVEDLQEAGTWLTEMKRSHQQQQEELTVRQTQLLRLLQLLEGATVVSRYQDLYQRAQTIQQHLHHLYVRASELRERMELVHDLRKKVPEAIAKLNGDVLEELFATMRSIFVKINSHPHFRQLAYDTTKKRDINHLFLSVLAGGDGEASQVQANPAYIFSAAQINAVALSFFLAMALQQQWSPLQLIALDDPVQSMDDLNVMALIDLIRTLLFQHQGGGRQIIISTHDATFYELMLKKFRFLRVGVLEYEGYSENGPLLYRDIREPLSSDLDISTFTWSERQATRA